MPNIHTEYQFEEGLSSLPSDIKKAIAIHDYSFFFIAYNEEKVFYALHSGIKTEVPEKSIEEVKDYISKKLGTEVFDNCSIQILAERFTLIPEGLYSEKDYASALDFIYPEKGNIQVLDSKIDSINSVLLSDTSSPLFSAVQKLSDNKNSEDFAAAWLQKILNVNSDGCFVHILSNSFLIALICNRKLQLFNRFGFSVKNDFLYFLLGSIQCTGVKNEETIIYLSGEISASSPLMEQISYYFAEVRFLQEKFEQNPESTKISHQFFTLINK